ncbi:glucosamine-6-phosphate deaminase [Pedobacter heparinus]|uniref:Glucosamine-6-phosphate deaminase n=1 Tax=Pedobacter heparinus (strain ATCC 13125 / DSM 2366 / CIP 104194 / JCM 7457 / NBRC 12017 / NCIMB 9290 / NRRL B-14731 / HIM 762-3) TaxID=485917 RepID=C6XUR0_PEDHD|nr:glucosamine-6-phosphate deaminase [Pedobacter heparinus]ACU03910.1 Glucosamine-6-phosphate deaminase [Pedobacter heparinus DSM 2366]
MIKEIQKDKLKIQLLNDRKLLGARAAEAVYKQITELLDKEPYINIIFAAAPSQNEFLAALIEKNIDWAGINAFHMDEYIGLDADAPQGFGNFLKAGLFDKVNFRSVNYINGNAADVEQECLRYEGLLMKFPPHIVCMGIGENTHIAFNDPHVAYFNDKKRVKIVDLDEECRQQQVNDGCFSSITKVPKFAITLTIPTLFSGKYLFCMVPGEKKARAVHHTIVQEVTEKYPSTILRKHENAIMFTDAQSSVFL